MIVNLQGKNSGVAPENYANYKAFSVSPSVPPLKTEPATEIEINTFPNPLKDTGRMGPSALR
jgi:hypothetical protein